MLLYANRRPHRDSLLAACLIALGFAASAQAAKFVPVALDDNGIVINNNLAAGSVETSNVYAPGGVSVRGEDGLWSLGDYRIAIDTASAALEASFSSQRINLRSYAAVHDSGDVDFKYTEANPELRGVWFYVAPSGTADFIGKSVELNLGLAWGDTKKNSSNVYAVLTGLTDTTYRRLTSKTDTEAAPVFVGSYYRLDLTHQTQVDSGTVLSAAEFEVSLQPLTTVQSPAYQIPGDYNGDGSIDSADYTVLRDGMSKPYNFDLDGDGDGEIGASDLSIWRAWFGTSLASATAEAVPEPATITVALLACAGAGVTRRR